MKRQSRRATRLVISFVALLGFLGLAPEAGAKDIIRTFTGRATVKDPSGNPVKGVPVHLSASSRYNVRSNPEYEWDTAWCTADAVTDATGMAYLSCGIPSELVEQYDSLFLHIADRTYSVLTTTDVVRTQVEIWRTFVALKDRDHNLVADEVELALAKKFAPYLILNSPDRGVRPSPVTIMDRNGDGRLGWEDALVQVFNLAGDKLGEFGLNEILFEGANGYYFGEERYPYLTAVMKESIIPGYHIEGNKIIPHNPPGIYILVPHFEWGEIGATNPESWYPTWDQAIARYQTDPRYAKGTTYASLFRPPNSSGEVVIQYWFFYPFNPAANRHEADWEHINVVLDSANLETARIARVEYYYHEEFVVAYDPGVDLELFEGTHPKVYVGGSNKACDLSGDGSHGSYPHAGLWRNINFVGTDENVDGLGLHIDFDNFQNVILMPNELPRTVYVQDPELTYEIGWQHFGGLWGYPLATPLPCQAELDIFETFLKGIVSIIPVGQPFAQVASLAIDLLREVANDKIEDANLAGANPRYHKRWHQLVSQPRATGASLPEPEGPGTGIEILPRAGKVGVSPE